MGKRELFGQKLVCIVLFIWAGVSVILNSTIQFIGVWKKDDVNIFVDYSVLILLVVNIVLFQRYTLRDIVVIAFGTLLIGYATITSNYNTLMAAWIFIVAAKQVDFSRIIKLVYYAQLMSLIIVLSMYYSKYIEDVAIYRGRLIRHSLGFVHPNQLGVVVFLLGAYRLYVRRNKASILDILILLLLAYFVKTVPNSKTSYYALFILAFILLVHIVIERLGGNFDYSSNVYIFIAAFANVFSIFMSLINVKKMPILKQIDSLMSSRFSMCNRTYNYYGITWFGQDVQLFIKKVALGKYYHFWLDNAYMALLLRYGIIVYLSFSFIYIMSMLIQKKKKNYLIVELMCLYAIYGIMENNFFSISQNLFLLLFECVLFQDKGVRFKEMALENGLR